MLFARALLIGWVCLGLVSSGGQVFAHGNGSSFELEQNGVLIDIGYTPDELMVGARVRFDLDLYDMTIDNNPALPFSNVWLRLTQNGRVFFSGNLYNPDRSQTVVTLHLPPAGEYELSARFYKEDMIVADAVFPLTIAELTNVEVDAELVPSHTSALSWMKTWGCLIAISITATAIFFFGLSVWRSVRKSNILQ